MAKYEGMFLIDNSRVKPEPEACVGVVNELLGKHRANVVRTDRWDERKLAYEIKKQKRATYVLSHFEMEPGKIQELRRDLEPQRGHPPLADRARWRTSSRSS